MFTENRLWKDQFSAKPANILQQKFKFLSKKNIFMKIVDSINLIFLN